MIALSLCCTLSDVFSGIRYMDTYQTAGEAEFGAVQNSLQHQSVLGNQAHYFQGVVWPLAESLRRPPVLVVMNRNRYL